MKNINKKLLVVALLLIVAGSAMYGQDIPAWCDAVDITNEEIPDTAIPFGTGIDILILLGGGFIAKKIRDKRKAHQ